MAGVVAAKETLMQPSPSAEALTNTSKLLSSAIALLGNSVFELSQRGREVMCSGINRNYRSLCDVYVPVTNQLFGDNIQDSITEINELAKVSKSVSSTRGDSRFHPYHQADRRSSYGSKQNTHQTHQSLNRRGQSAPKKDYPYKQGYKKPHQKHQSKHQ